MIKSVAIGSFDGIHTAHKRLIGQADGVVVIERGFASLTPGWKRSIYTGKPTFFYLFEKVKNLTPKEFIEKLQSDFPSLEQIVVGYDFEYGKNRSGNINTLKSDFKGKVIVVDEVKIDGISVHSRVIRKLLENSNLDLANRLLGRNYAIDGALIKGQGVGSKELVPTINLQTINYTLPKGVFATNTIIEGKRYKSVSFIGHRLSTDSSFAVETHIIENFNDSFNRYKPIWIEFKKFIRENGKFDSLKGLKEQILMDISKAKSV